MNTQPPYHAIALFSGGLDSILAARLIMEQGLRVRCLHVVTPFFGKPDQIEHWSRVYGLEMEALDLGETFVDMVKAGPAHGFGKVMNPCVDCKILMMRHAKRRMEELGASFLISGEVLGQRPMSQRKDTLNVIRRDGDVRDVLLRPLCARHLEPTEPERTGLVDRERLLGIFGRGRTDQLNLADRMGIREIPTPAGGCRLAEKENARRYWPLLERLNNPTARDFHLANVGRQHWSGSHWLCIGRNAADNDAFAPHVNSDDLLLKIPELPGPLAVARGGSAWSAETLREAAACTASFSPHAVRLGGPVEVRLWREGHAETGESVTVTPDRHNAFGSEEPDFNAVKAALKARYGSAY